MESEKFTSGSDFLEDKMHEVSGASRLLLVEKGVGLFSTVLRYRNGTKEYLPTATPAKDLIAAAEIDYRDYRREIKRLREEHPLFENRLNISVADFEDFVAEALLLPSIWENSSTKVCRWRIMAVHCFC